MNPAFSEVFHCTSRCVRRAFLCGWDPASGRDFEHRRLWIDERIAELALYFGISVISSSVMSNHFHIVLRTEPQWVASLSDAEVARRWLCVFPGPGGRRGHPPEAQAIEDLCLDTKKLALCRSRLSDISWFIELLDWTGRQIHAKKRGVIPAHLRPILERLNLQVDAWVDNVENYDSLFRRLAATLGRLRELAGSLGRSWLHGRAGARRLYTQHA
jgi:hypothetical protein